VASFLLLSLYPLETLGQVIVERGGTQLEIDWLALKETAVGANTTLHDQLALFYRFTSKHNSLTLYVPLFTSQFMKYAAGEEFGISMLALSWDHIFVYAFTCENKY
jgi:hypothetical protein